MWMRPYPPVGWLWQSQWKEINNDVLQEDHAVNESIFYIQFVVVMTFLTKGDISPISRSKNLTDISSEVIPELLQNSNNLESFSLG